MPRRDGDLRLFATAMMALLTVRSRKAGHRAEVMRCPVPGSIPHRTGSNIWLFPDMSTGERPLDQTFPSDVWCGLRAVCASPRTDAWWALPAPHPADRSEERRVGKECRCRWALHDYKKSSCRARQSSGGSVVGE